MQRPTEYWNNEAHPSRFGSVFSSQSSQHVVAAVDRLMDEIDARDFTRTQNRELGFCSQPVAQNMDMFRKYKHFKRPRKYLNQCAPRPLTRQKSKVQKVIDDFLLSAKARGIYSRPQTVPRPDVHEPRSMVQTLAYPDEEQFSQNEVKSTNPFLQFSPPSPTCRLDSEFQYTHESPQNRHRPRDSSPDLFEHAISPHTDHFRLPYSQGEPRGSTVNEQHQRIPFTHGAEHEISNNSRLLHNPYASQVSPVPRCNCNHRLTTQSTADWKTGYKPAFGLTQTHADGLNTLYPPEILPCSQRARTQMDCCGHYHDCRNGNQHMNYPVLQVYEESDWCTGEALPPAQNLWDGPPWNRSDCRIRQQVLRKRFPTQNGSLPPGLHCACCRFKQPTQLFQISNNAPISPKRNSRTAEDRIITDRFLYPDEETANATPICYLELPKCSRESKQTAFEKFKQPPVSLKQLLTTPKLKRDAQSKEDETQKNQEPCEVSSSSSKIHEKANLCHTSPSRFATPVGVQPSDFGITPPEPRGLTRSKPAGIETLKKYSFKALATSTPKPAAQERTDNADKQVVAQPVVCSCGHREAESDLKSTYSSGTLAYTVEE